MFVSVVLPVDPYIYIGNNLTLMCNLTRYSTDYHSQFLTFSRKNDEVIPSEYIQITSTRSIILRYPIRSPDDGGNYLCKLNRTSGRPEIIGLQAVDVECKLILLLPLYWPRRYKTCLRGFQCSPFFIQWPLGKARVGHLLHHVNGEILDCVLISSEIK